MEVVGGLAACGQLVGTAIKILDDISQIRNFIRHAPARYHGWNSQLDALSETISYIRDNSRLHTCQVERIIDSMDEKINALADLSAQFPLTPNLRLLTKLNRVVAFKTAEAQILEFFKSLEYDKTTLILTISTLQRSTSTESFHQEGQYIEDMDQYMPGAGRPSHFDSHEQKEGERSLKSRFLPHWKNKRDSGASTDTTQEAQVPSQHQANLQHAAGPQPSHFPDTPPPSAAESPAAESPAHSNSTSSAPSGVASPVPSGSASPASSGFASPQRPASPQLPTDSQSTQPPVNRQRSSFKGVRVDGDDCLLGDTTGNGVDMEDYEATGHRRVDGTHTSHVATRWRTPNRLRPSRVGTLRHRR
ncbi:hypothetical protein K449DRAFT_462081 [Hypoxylon sp. EC38]|nr:hypothetical protein K449DRAFT_462081 [Hypoxylon sp. EC38]